MGFNATAVLGLLVPIVPLTLTTVHQNHVCKYYQTLLMNFTKLFTKFFLSGMANVLTVLTNTFAIVILGTTAINAT